MTSSSPAECAVGGGEEAASPGLPEGGDQVVHAATQRAGEESPPPARPHHEAWHF